jgi:hypothetical protein
MEMKTKHLVAQVISTKIYVQQTFFESIYGFLEAINANNMEEFIETIVDHSDSDNDFLMLKLYEFITLTNLSRSSGIQY